MRSSTVSDLSCRGWKRCSQETCAVGGETGDFSAGDSLSERLCGLCQPREKETEILARHWTKSPCGSLTSMTSEVICEDFRLPFPLSGWFWRHGLFAPHTKLCHNLWGHLRSRAMWVRHGVSLTDTWKCSGAKLLFFFSSLKKRYEILTQVNQFQSLICSNSPLGCAGINIPV